jgi:membrane-associated protein
MMMDWPSCIIHLDQCLATMAQAYPSWVLGALFVVIFAETGLVIFPFLPGDSLLFIAGALTAVGGMGLPSPFLLSGVLVVAAVLGNTVNYTIGRYAGKQLLQEGSPWRRWIKVRYLEQTEAYFNRYGVLAIIVGRFAPIIRTFVPFLAGIGRMEIGLFQRYNVVGALSWIVVFVYSGYYFGRVPFIQKNLRWMMLGIVVLSLLPILFQLIKSIRVSSSMAAKKEKADPSII